MGVKTKLHKETLNRAAAKGLPVLNPESGAPRVFCRRSWPLACAKALTVKECQLAFSKLRRDLADLVPVRQFVMPIRAASHDACASYTQSPLVKVLGFCTGRDQRITEPAPSLNCKRELKSTGEQGRVQHQSFDTDCSGRVCVPERPQAQSNLKLAVAASLFTAV